MPMTRREALLSGGIAAVGTLPAFGNTLALPVTQSEVASAKLACLTDFEPVAKARMPLPA